MPRRSILSATERDNLIAIPDAKDELIRHYTLSESDLVFIRQHRGSANRLGFAVQLCYLRFPGIILAANEAPFPPLLHMVAAQLKAPVENWEDYGGFCPTHPKGIVRRFPTPCGHGKQLFSDRQKTAWSAPVFS